MTSVSVRINQSESFPAVMFTLHVLQITTVGIQADNPVSSVFVIVSENKVTICFGNFHTEYGKSVATVTLFS